jgi:hypothetical protein
MFSKSDDIIFPILLGILIYICILFSIVATLDVLHRFRSIITIFPIPEENTIFIGTYKDGKVLFIKKYYE